MARQFPALDAAQTRFIHEQHLFFVGSAAAKGRVNISPKGMDSLRVLGPNRIIWRNLTGSGNETAGHLLQENRITLMWCSFTKRPLILRCYGTARAVHVDEERFEMLNAHFPPHSGTRQVYDMAVDLVQTSCGYAVPFFEHMGERDTLTKWSEDRGADGLRAYWDERNGETIDGFPTK
ncbi:MAG: pyridoxamine 5'-phosphate oxidase [Rhodobacterales bacterium]|nr:MAG: pyridoxamine 5'-phosphate oxidase [Rhodobacterales bacterium]